MRIDVHGRNVPVSESLETFAHDRFQRALSRAGGAVRAVSIDLSDVNGPKGGVDKKCLANIHLAPRGRIVVNSTNEDLYKAIANVAHRTRGAVMRRVNRWRAA